jgi:peptidoglycan/LPS O-acetylase OafA/YrhL
LRIRELDVLRALAVLLVLGRHVPSVPGWGRAGWVGVDLFFVLSGFLISGLLFSEYKLHGKISVRAFLVRRGFKIYPPFYVFLAVTVAVEGAGSGARIASEAFFLQSYLPGMWKHTWSLAVEEHFYLFLAMLLWGLSRLRPRSRNPFTALPFIFIALAISAMALRLTNASLREFQFETHLFPSHLRVDSLFFGVLLGYAYHFRRGWLETLPFHRIRALSCACLLPCLLLPVGHPFMNTVGLTLLYAGFGGMVACAVCGRPSFALPLKVREKLAALGAHSYSIYLWHMAVADWGLKLFRTARDAQPGEAVMFRYLDLAVYLAGSLVLGVAMSKLVEVPALRLRNRLAPSRSAPALPVEVPIARAA